MCRALLRLSVGEVMKVSRFLLTFYNRLQLHTAQLPCDICRGECVTVRTGISASQLLRGQIFHRLAHGVNTLSMRLQGKCEKQREYEPILSHESSNKNFRVQMYDNLFSLAIHIYDDFWRIGIAADIRHRGQIPTFE